MAAQPPRDGGAAPDAPPGRGRLAPHGRAGAGAHRDARSVPRTDLPAPRQAKHYPDAPLSRGPDSPCAAVPDPRGAGSRAPQPTALPRASRASSNLEAGPRGRTRPAFDSAPYDAVPEPNEKFDATRSAFSSAKDSKTRRTDDFFDFVPEWRVFRSPVERAEPERGRLARRGAVAARGAESDERRRRRRRRRRPTGSRPFVRAGDAARSSSRSTLGVTTRRVRVRGRSDVFRVFRV